MRPIARQSARLAICSRTKQSQIAGKHHCERHSAFSSSAQRAQEPRSPGGSNDPSTPVNERREVPERKSEHGVARQEQATEQENPEQRGANDAWTYARKRSLRHKSGQDVPKPPPIPEWFFRHNVRLYKDFPGNGVSTDAGEVIRCIDNATGHTLFTIPYYDAWPDDPEWQIRRGMRAQKDDRANSDQPKETVVPPESGSDLTKASEQTAHPIQQIPDPTKPIEPAAPVTSQEKRLLLRTRNYDAGRWSFLEAESAVRAAFSLAADHQRPASFAVDRVDLSLQVPGPDPHNQMDGLVQDLAQIVGADLIRLDVNDFAELSQDYVGHGYDEPGSFSALAYDVYDGYDATSFGSPQARSSTKAEEEDEDDDVEPSESNGVRGSNLVLFGGTIDLRKLMHLGQHQPGNNSQIGQQGQSSAGPQSALRSRTAASDTDPNRDDERIMALLEQLIDSPKQKLNMPETPKAKSSAESQSNSRLAHKPLQESELETVPPSLKQFQVLRNPARARPTMSSLRGRPKVVLNKIHRRSRSNPDIWFPRTASMFVDYLVEAVQDVHILDAPVRLTSESRSSTKEGSIEQGPPKTIVHVRDLRDMCDTPLGEKIIHHLVNVLRKRRRTGQQIIIVGTTAQDGSGPYKPARDHTDVFPFLPLNIPPLFNFSSADLKDFESIPAMISRESLDSPEYTRIMEINLRHIQSMLHRLRPQDHIDLLSPEVRGQLNMPGTIFLTKRVLSMDEVQQLALTAVGLSQSHTLTDVVQPIHVALAVFVHTHASETARQWAAYIEKKQAKAFKTNEGSMSAARGNKESAEAKVDRLKKICSAHEARLLHGMVDPQNIKTTFEDVHASTDTIEALKNLTTLSFLRPDAFKYGVLANDRLPGLLLYGPPGTGKTLLAKAVAKESNATVLEVSGAQIYEKYVGEGEKMVQAVFSLAKKLSPCVVFIDEADAIFGSRGHSANRNSHRQIINQFLREWDGMDDHSVFMMVATNRPFDLDDAVLRRLPRRLLVDLPVAKDRESILGIHLKHETLDASVSLGQLAEQTPLYSGSDLKNLAVSAALACVREENELAAANREDKDFKLPERRTLRSKHFDTALAEISASISEDMSSLNAVRKFDEQYGDRKGRRKKKAYGFGSSDESVNEESARVRQSPSTTSASPPP